jgi:hypothetical protein
MVPLSKTLISASCITLNEEKKCCVTEKEYSHFFNAQKLMHVDFLTEL